MKGFKSVVAVVMFSILVLPASKACAGAFADAAAALEAEFAAMQAQVVAQQTTIEELQNKIAALEANAAVRLGASGMLVFDDVSILNNVVGPHVIFEGVNVHVRNGGGTTDQVVNGLGNLIIGYNEYNHQTGGGQNAGDRGGAHNLIMGRGHIYKNNSNIAHGWGATLLGYNSAAIASDDNTIDANYSATLGGRDNTIERNIMNANSSVAVGGQYNTVSSRNSVAVSGQYNILNGQNSIISGGEYNTTNGDYSSVGGGNGITVDTTDGWSAPGH